jgi:hypothetical protein
MNISEGVAYTEFCFYCDYDPTISVSCDIVTWITILISETSCGLVGFEVLTAVSTKMAVF